MKTYAGRTGFRTWARLRPMLLAVIDGVSTPAAPVVGNDGAAQGGGHEGEGTMSDEWKQYRRKGASHMRPWKPGDDMTGISVSQPDKAMGSPKAGDMISRNPKNHEDQWLVAKAYFEENLEPVPSDDVPPSRRSPEDGLKL